jgi:fucose permease
MTRHFRSSQVPSGSTFCIDKNMSSQSHPNETSPLLQTTALSSASIHDVSPTAQVDEKPGTLGFRIVAAMYSFALLGLFASSIGVMLPSISHHYTLSDLRVSLIFLVNPIGYVAAAQSNDLIHAAFGQRGIAFLAPIFHIIAALSIAIHPHFYVLLVAFAVVQFGTGLVDGPFCAWAAVMENPNRTSGLLHGSFSVGAAVGPFLATTLMTFGHRPWFDWYYVLVSNQSSVPRSSANHLPDWRFYCRVGSTGPRIQTSNCHQIS